jgi:ATP-dependent DNA helicase RecG
MKFDARKLMERAVAVMGESVKERRADGKASPLVGALLWLPDGSVTTACRGELRDGDHAEFTLLERKHRHVRVEDGVLFATLEPCAPGARKEPKRSCAERIVLARIKRVYVGIQDPDPTVDRKGIKYLQDNGVDVQMFDRDLQDQIEEANKNFIEQAEERAAAAREEKKPVSVSLSPLESAPPGLALKDFSRDVLERYRRALKVEEAVTSETFSRRLLHQGLVSEVNGILRPTGFGALLFGRAPRDVMPQAGILGTIHYAGGGVETRDLDGPLIQVPGELEQWLRDKLPNLIDRNRMERRVAQPLPFEVVREGLVNALVHRDYGIDGAKCQFEVTPEAIKIMSPGEPLRPITLDQLNRFAAPMLSRNPPLHFVFAKLEMAEERGLGMRTLREMPEKFHLPAPRYAMDGPYLVLTISLTASGAVAPAVLSELTPTEREGWAWVALQRTVTAKRYSDVLEIEPRTAKRHLRKFVDLGLLRPVGAGRATHYERNG